MPDPLLQLLCHAVHVFSFPKLTVRSLLHKSDELTRLVIAFAQQRTATVCAPNWWAHSGLSRVRRRAGFHARGERNIDCKDGSKTASCSVISLKKGGTP
jgi:hypothetical protein